MDRYRIYVVAPDGSLSSGDWIEAASDEEAKRLARARCTPGTPLVELWKGSRRVALIACPEREVRRGGPTA